MTVHPLRVKEIRKYFNTRMTSIGGRARVWSAVCDYLRHEISFHKTVLDIGAGHGDFINQIDADEKMAVDANPETAQWCNPDVKFYHAELPVLPLADQTVDVIFASNVLEHFDTNNLLMLMQEIRRCLRPGGKLILMQPNIYYAYRVYWDDFTHVKAFSHRSLFDFLTGEGFEVIRMEKRFLPFSFRSHFPASRLLTRLYLASPWRPLAGQMLCVAKVLGKP